MRARSQKQPAGRPDAAGHDFELWEAELRPGRLARWGGWLLRAFGDVAHRDGFVLVTGGGVCWHCYVPTDPAQVRAGRELGAAGSKSPRTTA